MSGRCVTSATSTPRDASIATRPCLISASRHFLMSPGAAPSDRPRGSKICSRNHDRHGSETCTFWSHVGSNVYALELLRDDYNVACDDVK